MSNAIKSLPHQNILIENDRFNGKVSLVRQERFGFADWKSSLIIKDKQFEVLNYSSFGLALITQEKIFQDNETSTFEGVLQLQDIQVQKLDLKLVYQKLLGENYKIALEVVGKPIDVEQISAALEGLSLVKSFTSQQQSERDISPDFKRVIFEIKDIFCELSQTLEETERQWNYVTPQIKRARERGMGVVVAHYLDRTLNRSFASVEKHMADLKDTEKVQYLNFLRHKLAEFIWDAPMAHRAYYKPQGFAGDFEMMNLIYRDEYEGKNLFAKCLHKYYISQAAAKSVRNRVAFLVNKFQKVIKASDGARPIRILSVASGPAHEVQKLLEEQTSESPPLHITLFDQDLKALQYAQQKLKELVALRRIANVEIHYRHSAVKNLIVSDALGGEKFDFIYSAGLFDYFSDSVFIACAKQLYTSLSQGGSLLIGNFDINNPTRALMEVVLDWNLIYRSKDEIGQLALAVCPTFSIDAEKEGINLFVELKKT